MTQQFFVPTGATRLYLFFVDAIGYSGSPGYYGDNTGSIAATFTIAGTVPEPSSLALCGVAAVVGLGFRRARGDRAARPTGPRDGFGVRTRGPAVYFLDRGA